MLMAPVFALFRERADIVVQMRLFMVPLYAASLVAVYRIARALFAEPVAIWLALIAGGIPGFFFFSAEFRPDDLYMTLWLWALVLPASGRFSARAMALAGLLLGACAGITLKTSMLVIAAGSAAGITAALRWWLCRERPLLRKWLRKWLVNAVALGLAGLIIPALLVAYFAAHHALPAMVECVLRNNIVPNQHRWTGSMLHLFYFPLGLPLVAACGIAVFKTCPDPRLAARRLFIALLPALYYLLLFSYWPDITNQDHLPALPLVPIALAALACPLIERFRSYAPIVLAAGFFLLLGFIWQDHTLQRGRVTKYEEPIATVLQLVKPGECVMDLKGDSIYRPRPIYYVIETFAALRMERGLIPNDIVPKLIATQTAVCFHPPYPGNDAKQFVRANYLPLDVHPNVWVLGQQLPRPATGNTVKFTTAFPADYVILQGDHPAAGKLDGAALDSPRTLPAGEHVFEPGDPATPTTLLWARAWQLGFRPAPPRGGNQN
jgi:4-amino-4-deoxy-L-arabinose transferase-like glycosyltransferase